MSSLAPGADYVVEPDYLDLRSNGTAVLAFAPRDDGTVPAWWFARPRMGQLRRLSELWADLVAGRKARLAEIEEETGVNVDQLSEIAAQATNDTDVERVLDASRAITRTVEDLMWPWITAVIDTLGTPMPGWTPPADVDEAPPWLIKATSVYLMLDQHWTSVPLARGNPAPIQARPGISPPVRPGR